MTVFSKGEIRHRKIAPFFQKKTTLLDAAKVIHSFTAGEKDQLRYADAFVVNDQNQLAGRITMTDILRGLAPQLIESTKVAKFKGKTAAHALGKQAAEERIMQPR